MFTYIWNDVVGMIQYLPYGLVVGAVWALGLHGVNYVRKKKGKEPVKVGIIPFVVTYFIVIVYITFWSRDLGSRTRKVDLELFSSWGRSARTHAMVLENILLFIPYGFLTAWRWRGRVFIALCIGVLTSLLIETMQLVTGRGFFQLDDVLTNTLGMLIGAVFCAILAYFWRKKHEKDIDCSGYAE